MRARRKAIIRMRCHSCMGTIDSGGLNMTLLRLPFSLTMHGHDGMWLMCDEQHYLQGKRRICVSPSCPGDPSNHTERADVNR